MKVFCISYCIIFLVVQWRLSWQKTIPSNFLVVLILITLHTGFLNKLQHHEICFHHNNWRRLLIGQVIDTNSAWMAQELNKAGIWVKRRVAVGDNRDHIWKALDQETEAADLVLITGGLGPTADDITKSLLCSYFGGKMVVDEKALPM